MSYSHNKVLEKSSQLLTVLKSTVAEIYTGDETIQVITAETHYYMSSLFKICEGIAMLDLVSEN